MKINFPPFFARFKNCVLKFCIVTLMVVGAMPLCYSQNSTWIFFRDKGPDIDYLLERPDLYLSPKAIERRIDNGIQTDVKDVPVYNGYLQKMKAEGFEIIATSRWLNAAVVKGSVNPSEIKSDFDFVIGTKQVMSYSHSGIPEGYKRISTQTSPQSSMHKTTTGLNYGESAWQNNMLNLSCLHDRGFTGRGVLMTLCDAGFNSVDTMHVFDSLWIENRVIAQRDFVDGDTILFDADAHGEMVLSTIAGNESGFMIGTAPHVSVLLARTEDVFSETHQEEYNWVNAMEWADSIGTQMIHSSLGYSVMDSGVVSYLYSEMDGNTTVITIAADVAASRGILVVNSAGNSGGDPWHFITAPCDGDSVLCVGAVDSFEVKAGFSSFGPSSDGRVKPDVMAMGLNSAITTPWDSIPVHGSGTSFSGPIMAGMAACLIQAHPNRSNMQIIQAIRESSDRFNTPDTLYGYGIPDACIADSILEVLDSIALSNLNSNVDLSLSLFPNPGTDKITLHRKNSFEGFVCLIDLTGRIFIQDLKWRKGEGDFVMDISGIPVGVYLVKVTTAHSVWMGKCLKISGNN